MTCNKCGKEIPEGAKKCDDCGKKVKVKFKDLPKKQKIIRIVIACVCFLVAGILMFGDALGGASRTGDSSSEYVELVKNNAFKEYPDQTVGDAFESFFADPKWNSFASEEGYIIVEFNGGCTWSGEAAECCIQFIVLEDGTFETYYADINGEALEKNDVLAMYNAIYGIEEVMSYEEAISYLYKKSALPSGAEMAVQAGVYSAVSVADVINYMFDNPEVDISVDEAGNTLIKFSGNYRYAIGYGCTENGFVTYSISENGSMILRKDGSDGIESVIESIAVQLAT